MLIGLLFVWEGIPHTYSVICQRKAKERVDCLKQEKVLWWIPIRHTSLKHLQAVRMGKGENAYDDTLYFIYLYGESNNLMFGNSLYLEDIQKDLLKAQQFLKNSETQSLMLERYEAHWDFAIVGVLIGTLGFWTVIYGIVAQKVRG